jgi:hypothetical protein
MVWLSKPGELTLLLVAGGLFITGIMLLSFEEILNRLRYIEFLLETSPAAGPHQIKTALGDFELLGDVEGKVVCIGCNKTAPRAGMYYSKSLDVHYHPACLARDRKR